MGQTWGASGVCLTPRNAITGRAYSGINVLLLWLESIERGFTQDRWLTFRQAKEAGGNVRKGERSTLACLYKPMSKPKLDENGEQEIDEEGNPVEQRFAILRGFNLFNIDQCEGLSEDVVNPPRGEADDTLAEPFLADDVIDAFIEGCGVRIDHVKGDAAFYSPAQDRIVLPSRELFTGRDGYYSVALHELVHASGHVSRLDRVGVTEGATFGSETYAFEELIAQMGSAFLCGHFGIHNLALDASYIGAWIKVLKDDKRALFRASGAARTAAEYWKQIAEEHQQPFEKPDTETAAAIGSTVQPISRPRRPQVDDQDIELFGHLWPLGDSVKLDPTIARGQFRAQVSRLKQLGYQFDAASQTWSYTAAHAA